MNKTIIKKSIAQNWVWNSIYY